MLKRLSALGLLLALVTAAGATSPPATPGAEWLLEHVKTLSAPAMDGRRSGTPGGALAARHVTRMFRAAGLKPGGDGGAYLQTFQVPTDIRLGSKNDAGVVAPFTRAWAIGRDFAPLAVSDNGSAMLDVVFAGYGITAPDLQYDDYAGIDVGGKAVLVLTGEPRGRDPARPFRRPDAYHYSERRHKILNARQHGAMAVLLVAHPHRATSCRRSAASRSRGESLRSPPRARPRSCSSARPARACVTAPMRSTARSRPGRPRSRASAFSSS